MNLGQVYTTDLVANFMVSLFDLPYNSRILDPCFGGGAFVNALFATSKYQIDAIEIDPNSFCAYKPPSHHRLNLFCSNFFEHIGYDYDGIIMNPPYVRHEEIDHMESLGVTKNILRKSCTRFNVPSKANLYVYFIIRAIELLRNNGQLVVIFPSSWVHSTLASFIYQVFSIDGHISQFISVLGNPFVGDPIVDVCIIKYIKGKAGSTKHQTLVVSDGSINLEDSNIDSQIYNSEHTIPLGSICFIKRGLTTFYNKMFINPSITESDFLQPILSSPKSLQGWTTEDAHLDRILLLPNTKVLSQEMEDYINLFRKQILQEGKPITLFNRINSMKNWYVLPVQTTGKIIFPYIIRNRPAFILNTNNVIVRDNFYLISHSQDDLLLFALLNNYYIYSQLESKGKNYGNGVLKIQKYDVDSILIMDPLLIDSETKSVLKSLAQQMIDSKDPKYLGLITDKLTQYYPSMDIENIYHTLKQTRLHS